MSEKPENPAIVLRRGGWFVNFSTGWSGPWRTREAAELARDHDYLGAHEAERKAPTP